MLDFFIYQVLVNLSLAYNVSGMPDFLRYQIQLQAEQFIEDNYAKFSIDVSSGRMKIVVTEQLELDDSFVSLQDVEAIPFTNAYISNRVILDLVD